MWELPAGPELEMQGQNAPVTVLIVILEQPRISSDGSPNKVCLDQVGLWVCLRGLALIMSIDVGRLSPLWAAISRKDAEHK